MTGWTLQRLQMIRWEGHRLVAQGLESWRARVGTGSSGRIMGNKKAVGRKVKSGLTQRDQRGGVTKNSGTVRQTNREPGQGGQKRGTTSTTKNGALKSPHELQLEMSNGVTEGVGWGGTVGRQPRGEQGKLRHFSKRKKNPGWSPVKKSGRRSGQGVTPIWGFRRVLWGERPQSITPA